MFRILHALGMFVADLFKSRSRLEAENLLLRHQLAIALRRKPLRVCTENLSVPKTSSALLASLL
jgi:hypothetical protein